MGVFSCSFLPQHDSFIFTCYFVNQAWKSHVFLFYVFFSIFVYYFFTCRAGDIVVVVVVVCTTMCDLFPTCFISFLFWSKVHIFHMKIYIWSHIVHIMSFLHEFACTLLGFHLAKFSCFSQDFKWFLHKGNVFFSPARILCQKNT